MATKKQRLDKLIVERGLVPTRAKGRAFIMAGEVLVNGEPEYRPGANTPVDAVIELKTRMPYVGRGGFKLAGALEEFGIDVSGRDCADVGACTGGFTDVLLQNGAAKVYAIDVGYGQLDWKLRQNERVVVLERTNARYLNSLGELVQFVAIDVSFISLKLILPSVRKWLTQTADVVALIKPQFEAGRTQVGKGGIVKDPYVHRQVLRDVLTWAAANEWRIMGVMRSPIEGTDGNAEFLAWLRLTGEGRVDLAVVIENLLGQELG